VPARVTIALSFRASRPVRLSDLIRSLQIERCVSASRLIETP
jgi:hypothetical protein